MNRKIKETFLKIWIPVFAIASSFVVRSFWGNALNLGKIEDGSKKVFKNVSEDIKTNAANADVVPSCASCGDGDGDAGDSGGAGGDCDDSDGCM